MGTIEAETAKLAGLQIDTLQKVRSGQMTLNQWERFNNLSPEDREARFGNRKKSILVEPAPKFALLADLGIITVPADYDHAKCLANFRKNNYKKFFGYNDDITDKNFSNPSRILKPGDKLHVRAFQQIVGGTTTSEERMAFLKKQNPVFVGAQGASLVFEQKHEQLPKGKWYASFDKKERLWKDAGSLHRVPNVNAYSDGDFFWNLGRFECVWIGFNAFLCFCDEPLDS
jgi:hypothetical protein